MQRTCFSLACFFTCVSLAAQQYPFVHYTPKDGLVNSRVRKAYQDSKGRMYFITYGGLSVYDGARFRNYTTQNGLLNDLVNDVLEVGEDSLLVAINTCGLNVLVRGQMKQINTSDTSCPVINQFLKSKDGNVYATADDGLYKLSPRGFAKLSTHFPGRSEPLMYLGNFTEYKDFLIMTTNDLRGFTGLFLYDKKENGITDVLPGQFVYSMKKDRDGLIWISTRDAIKNLDTSALQIGKLVLTGLYASFINHAELEPGSIVFNNLNEPLISSTKKGITRYRRDGTQLTIDPPEQPGFVVRDYLSDHEDVLWMCHDGNGVYKLSNTRLRSMGSYFSNSSAGIRSIRSITPDTCWLSTLNGQVTLNTAAGNKYFTPSPSFTINAMFCSGNNLYAADLRKLYMARIPAVNETTIRFRQILSLEGNTGFGGEFVTDPYGNIILFESRNICVLQNDKLIFKYTIDDVDLIEGFYVDTLKRLWVISRSNGLRVFTIHPEDPTHYLQPAFNYLKEFENASPRSMTVDKYEILWVGTRHHGILAFELKNNQLKKRWHFRRENGITDNFITALASDNNGNILAGTQTGLDRLIRTDDPAQVFRVENITKSSNIFSYIYDVWTDARGHAFALTNTGTVLQVDDVQHSNASYQPQLFIEEIKINGHRTADLRSPKQLKYDQRNITFSVAAPAFTDEKQVRYSYLLSGSGNNEWSDTSSVADITLLNLSPGNYTLHVKAFFHSTTYAPKEMTFSFNILPPWWQTWWFRSGIGVLGILILAGAIRFYYRRKLERQRIILEKQQAVEKERTRIATDMHDDLGAGLSRIKFLSETIGIKKQQQQSIDEDVTRIRQYSHEMIDKMGEIVWALNEKNDTLSDLLSYTRAYAVDYLSQNGIRCTVDMPENFPVTFVNGEFRRNVYLTVKEALHNIIKHAQASAVTISIFADKSLHMRLKDDGVGLNKETLRPFSNGITNMQKRIAEIGGEFEIIGADGTEIKFSVPLPE